MRCAIALAVVVAMSMVTGAMGQIIYLPVQYQYGQGNPYYYAGSDPRIHVAAAYPRSATWGRINGHAFVSGNVHTHREVATDGLRIYSDCRPFVNMATYGMTVADVHNETYQRVPRYFRKGDLIRSAVVMPDGTVVVPATADPERERAARGSIIIRKYQKPATRPAPKPLIIIPKDALKAPQPRQVASAE
jgi:hypothetical protein